MSSPKTHTTKKITVALVDDHNIFRSGINMILTSSEKYEVVIDAADGKMFLDALEHVTPDIVLLDISMPVMDGYKTTLEAYKKIPDINIIALTMLSEDDYYYKMIKAGVKGFVLKNSDIDELMRAIDEVARGNNYFTQDFLKKMVLKINNPQIDSTLNLNSREKEVLQHICNGYTNKEISEKMYLSVKSIERYRNILLQKTETRNTAQLVKMAILDKLIEL